MEGSAKQSIRIDLSQFKLHIHLQSKTELTLHFDSPSRRFYLSVIALVVNEMKRLYKIGVHSFYRPRAWGDAVEEASSRLVEAGRREQMQSLGRAPSYEAAGG